MSNSLSIDAKGFAPVQLYTGNGHARFAALPPYLNNSHFVVARRVVCNETVSCTAGRRLLRLRLAMTVSSGKKSAGGVEVWQTGSMAGQAGD
jgi:hypothetical protein